LIISENIVDSSAFIESRFRKMLLRNKRFCFVVDVRLSKMMVFYFKKH